MFTKIIDPVNNKEYNILSVEGKKVLKNYIKEFYGGTKKSSNKQKTKGCFERLGEWICPLSEHEKKERQIWDDYMAKPVRLKDIFSKEQMRTIRLENTAKQGKSKAARTRAKNLLKEMDTRVIQRRKQKQKTRKQNNARTHRLNRRNKEEIEAAERARLKKLDEEFRRNRNKSKWE